MSAKSLEQIQALKPTTLSGVKSVAKELARATGLRHSQALDAAARQGGHTSWAAALRANATQGDAAPEAG